MRLYALTDNWHHEIKRDVIKRGKWVHTGRMQDKDTEHNDDYNTKELMNYSFALLNVANLESVKTSMSKCDFEWADAELAERISNEDINPGIAWEIRKNVWTEFLKRNNGQFAYSYNTRIRTQMTKIIDELQKHKYTRQAIISIYNPTIDNEKIGVDRVPCSIYYQLLYRDNKLHIIYNMRSCDAYTHYHNDIYLAVKLLHHIATECQMDVGNFYMNIGSLHAYKKDIPKKDLEEMY